MDVASAEVDGADLDQRGSVNGCCILESGHGPIQDGILAVQEKVHGVWDTHPRVRCQRLAHLGRALVPEQTPPLQHSVWHPHETAGACTMGGGGGQNLLRFREMKGSPRSRAARRVEGGADPQKESTSESFPSGERSTSDSFFCKRAARPPSTTDDILDGDPGGGCGCRLQAMNKGRICAHTPPLCRLGPSLGTVAELSGWVT